MPRFSLIKQMADSKSVIGLNMLTVWDELRSDRRGGVTRSTELLADGTIRPVVAESFSFERAGDAHRFISERREHRKGGAGAMTEALKPRPADQATRAERRARCARRSS